LGVKKRLVWLAIPLAASAALLSLLTGCGGGGGGSTSPMPTPTVSVAVSPKTATVAPGAQQQFNAEVTGTANTAVTWQVNGTTGGNSTVGTISGSGLYTGPAAVPSGNSVMVTAVSQADATKNDSATVTISHPALASLNPDVTMAGVGGFSLTVNGAAFTSSSQVLFNGAATPTTFVSSSQLVAQIAASDVAQASPAVGYPVAVQTGTSQTAVMNFYVVPPVGPQGVSVTAGPATHVPTLNANPDGQGQPLVLSSVGIGNSAGVTGGQVSPGSSVTLLLVGSGIVPGTFYAVSGPKDVTVTQPVTSDFANCTSGNGGATTPCVKVTVSVSAAAVAGSRNIIVSNTQGELSAFVGGLSITE